MNGEESHAACTLGSGGAVRIVETDSPVLRGRADECAQLDRLREGALAGRGGALMLRGEAGVGKTALLEYAITSAATPR